MKNDFVSMNFTFKLHIQFKHLISLLEHYYCFIISHLFILNKKKRWFSKKSLGGIINIIVDAA